MASSEVIDRVTGLAAPAVATPRARASSSLRWRLPLLTCALLGAVGLAFAYMAHREVERALRLNGHERIVAAARQVSDMFAQSIAARTIEVHRLVADPDVQRLARAQQLSAPEPAPAALRAVTTRPQGSAVYLYAANGTPIAQLPLKGDTWQTPPADAPHAVALAEGVGPLQIRDGQVVYRTTGKVVAEDGTSTAGYLSFERSLSASQVGAVIERMMGSGAALKLGNATRDVWTDFSVPVAAPPVAAPGAPASYVNAQGDVRVGTAIQLAGAPWLLWTEMSEAAFLAPARTLSQRMIPITLGLMAIGVFGIYSLSRRITIPLEQLVGAAEGVETGDYARRVTSTRTDEIGRLGHAFNAMAARVEETHHNLEARVQARTAELETALVSLRETQEELVRRERLAMLGQLSSSVGHELRNPLGVMTNAVYYLKMIQADAPAQVGEYLGILQHQIGLAEKIVGDLLDFARLRPPQVQTVAVRQLVDEQVARLGPLDKVTIVREGLDAISTVQIDPVQIGQVLFNLLTNAHQAMEGVGTITVRGRQSGEVVVLEVADTGRGIAPEVMEKIFEPLFTTKARGIGLGLAVSRTLAASNGGQLTAASEVGRGATFSLTMPIVRKAAA